MPKISFTSFDAAALERMAAQARYVEQAASRRGALLERRRAQLPTVKQFNAAVRQLREVGMPERDRPVEVSLRRPLVRNVRGRRTKESVLPRNGDPERGTELSTYNELDRESRPPAAQLVRSANGLRLALISYYVARATTAPGSSPSNPYSLLDGHISWAGLLGLAGVPRAKRRRFIVRALNELERAQLIGLGEPGGYGRYEAFTLLLEHPNTDRAYTVPGEDTGLPLPASLWWYGWHLVLTAGEMLTLLMFAELANYHHEVHAERGVGASETERWGRYGISGETYNHHRTLQGLGLLEPVPDTVVRQRGKVDTKKHGKPTEVYRFRVRLDRLEGPDGARGAMAAALDAMIVAPLD